MNKIKLQKEKILSIFFLLDCVWGWGTFMFFAKTWRTLRIIF